MQVSVEFMLNIISSHYIAKWLNVFYKFHVNKYSIYLTVFLILKHGYRNFSHTPLPTLIEHVFFFIVTLFIYFYRMFTK